MFSYIKGNLEVKSNGFVVIDVNGIGFKIFMYSFRTIQRPNSHDLSKQKSLKVLPYSLEI